MAKSGAGGGKGGGGETLQIVILTLFMMGGCFALISGFLWVYLVPARADEVSSQVTDFKKLYDLLDKNQNAKTGLWDLRHRVKEAEKAHSSLTLREMVEAEQGTLQWSSFPKTISRPIGNTLEQNQSIDLKDAPLNEILSFVARVKQANPSVQVGSLRVTRTTRAGPTSALSQPSGGGDDDRWSATVNFYLYTTGAGGAKPAAGAAGAPAAAEGADSLIEPEK
jgi:hypothetical protein